MKRLLKYLLCLEKNAIGSTRPLPKLDTLTAMKNRAKITSKIKLEAPKPTVKLKGSNRNKSL